VQDQLALVDGVGDRGDDDLPLAARQRLDPVLAAEPDGALPALVDVAQLLLRVEDLAPGREVGPFTCFSSPFTSRSGSSIMAVSAATTSLRLWGGMLVAIPTAIPVEPFIRSCGMALGRTVGSSSMASKVARSGTVSAARSASISSASAVRRASV